MLFRIAVTGGWIALTLGLFVVVALSCARLPHHPFGVRLYRLARGTVSRPHRYAWFGALFIGCLMVLTVGIYAGVAIVDHTGHWQHIGTCLAVAAASYSSYVLWPRSTGEKRWKIMPLLLALNAAGILASAFVWLPGWVVNHIGGLIIAVPVLIWFRSLRVRTAACLALAFAVHDGIHVFGTDLMDRFMAPFNHTPFILYLPRDTALWPLASLGHGDVVVPGILVVVAGRMAARRAEPRLLWGTCLGVAIGFAASFAWTGILGGSFPMLVTLVPGGLLGYAIATLKPNVKTPHLEPAAAVQTPKTF